MDPRRNRRDKLDARTLMPSTKAEAATRVALANGPASKTPPHVLIVDDDADILDVLQTLFTDDGFRPVCCNTNETALTALAAEPAQLVITDLRLVGGTGIDLIRQVRALYGNLPGVIVLTAARPGYADVELEQIARMGGRIMAKPFDIDDLLDVAHALTGWPGRALP